MNDFFDKLDSIGDDDDRVFFIVDCVMDLELESKFLSIDDILQTTDVNKYSEDVLVALLSSTYSCKSELKNREDFYNRAYIKLQKEIPNDVDSALYGLK